jgi:hypothetical protein
MKLLPVVKHCNTSRSHSLQLWELTVTL